MLKNYRTWDGLGLAQAIRDKKLSPSEALDSAITLADTLNPALNAIVMRHDEEARTQNIHQGVFSGVPFLLKNLHLGLKGTSTDGSFQPLQNKPATRNTFLVDDFLQAGFVVFGKTNSPELGLTGTTEPRLYGATKNPWAEGLSPAGSSGGAGAAVAVGIVPVAHASDGGGSIRMPASANGLVGMKPSRGRVSVGPDRGEGWAGMSCNGVVSRTVRDSAAALDALARFSPGEPYSAPAPATTFLEVSQIDPKQLRIAANWHRPNGEKLGAPMVAFVQETAHLCENLGHAVEEAAPAYDPTEAGRHQIGLISAHIAALCEDVGATEAQVERATWRTALYGKKQTAQDYVRGVNYIHGLSRVAGNFHETYDIYLCPVFGVEGFQLGELDMMSEDNNAYVAAHQHILPFTSFANMTGQPSLSLPLCWNADGTPVGMMFTAAFGKEDLLFQLAGQIERAHPWAARYESLWQKLA